MFTGIIEEVGAVKTIGRGIHSSVLTIEAEIIFEDIHIGDSIAVNGVCLTVTSFTRDSFQADVMHETLKRSNLGLLKAGSPVNLERALAVDGRFGGHIVSGHIDGTGTITRIKRDDIATWYTISAAEKLMRYIVEKGSVAIDGISLTVAAAAEGDFSVSIIPHTSGATILSQKRVSDVVNLENDIVGKYIERLTPPLKGDTAGSRITKEFLERSGF